MPNQVKAQADWAAAVAARATQAKLLADLAARAEQVRKDADAQLAMIRDQAAAINEAMPDLLATEEVAYRALLAGCEQQATNRGEPAMSMRAPGP